VLHLVEEAELGDSERILSLLEGAAITPNEAVQGSIERAVAAKAFENLQYPFDRCSFRSDLRIGQTSTGADVGFSPDDLTRHLLSVGQSGSGKTTLFYSLFAELEESAWFFDLKQDYRHLTRNLDLLVLPWGELRFNPLRPPEGVSPRRWAQVFSEVFGHATALLSGSKNYLLKKIVQLYQTYNLFEGVSPPYPSLHELEVLIEEDTMNYVRKSSDYRETVLNRLEAMNLVAGTVFNCSQGYGVEELLKQDVVFEFDGLSRDVQNFLMEILFAYVYEYRLSQNHRGEGINHVFFLDEGKRVFSVYKERQDASGIPEIDELTAKMREFGEGLVVADQEASKLTDSIKANTYTKVLLPTGDRKQFQAVAESMNLSERQMEFAQELGTGEALVQVGNRGPVPVDLDNYTVEKQVSDSQLRDRMQEKWNRLSNEPRETTTEFNQIIGGQQTVEEHGFPDDPEGKEVDLSSEAVRLLEDVVENPFKPLSDRYERFSSSYQGNKAKNTLVDEGVVIERNIRSQEGKRKLLELTDKGRDYVEKSLGLEVKHRGRGGVVHRYWQHRIKQLFEEAGWTAELEMFDADVYVNLHDSELVVEVAMGNNQREIEHLEKHLDTGFDSIWIACRNEEIRDGLQQKIEEKGLEDDRVVFRLSRQFKDIEKLSE